MSSISPQTGVSNLWKAFHNMPTKTTIIDRVIEKEKAAEKAHIDSAIAQATDRKYILSKKVEGTVFKRLESAKKEQTENTLENINEFRRFIGKGMKVDTYV